MSYSHEIDALNALVTAVERNNQLIERLLEREEADNERPRRGRKPK